MTISVGLVMELASWSTHILEIKLPVDPDNLADLRLTRNYLDWGYLADYQLVCKTITV